MSDIKAKIRLITYTKITANEINYINFKFWREEQFRAILEIAHQICLEAQRLPNTFT